MDDQYAFGGDPSLSYGAKKLAKTHRKVPATPGGVMRLSITLVRQKIDELVIILQSGTRTGLQIGQVEILCDDIDRLIRNELMPTGQQALPAADNGIPRDSYIRIRDIMP